MGRGTTDIRLCEADSCCGTTCDKQIMIKELKVQGAKEFVRFVNSQLDHTPDLDNLLLRFLRVYC